jgi:hypothetical protein
MAPDLGSSTGPIRRCIFGICTGGCNAVDGRKDKQDDGIIFFCQPNSILLKKQLISGHHVVRCPLFKLKFRHHVPKAIPTLNFGHERKIDNALEMRFACRNYIDFADGNLLRFITATRR